MDANANPLGIKKVSAPAAMSSRLVIRREDMAALSEAASIIAAADVLAHDITRAAEEEALKIRSDARDETSREVWAEAKALLDDLKKLREEVTEQSIEAAQSILQKAWEIVSGDCSQTEKLRCALHQAGRYFVSTTAMKIRVHPNAMDDAKTWLDERRNTHPGLELITIEPDTSVRPEEVRLYLDRGGVIRADFVGTLEILKAKWS
ncbi:MAG: HrpE/YscL/FliH and V-type ATPase subunit [Pseudomonadota bacterium]|jgi:flagellar biosynthesis/type III secretory pathway protein FliH